MNATKNAVNPYEYNADLIPEHHWFFKSTIVLKQPASESTCRKLKNKEVVKWIHQTCKSCLGQEIMVPYKLWFATCCSEIQKDSELLHFHLIFGNVFSQEYSRTNPHIVFQREKTANLIEKLILSTPFLGQTTGYYSVEVLKYQFKSECIRTDGKQSSWIGYKFKKEQNPYWSDYFQKIVTLKNKADTNDDPIPKILFDLGFKFPPKRIQLHNDAVDSGYGDTTED